MNIFEILNSQYISQSQYDKISHEQQTYLKYVNHLPLVDWQSVYNAGILDICYNHYKSIMIIKIDYQKERNSKDISQIENLQKLYGTQFDYVADYLQFMGIVIDEDPIDQLQSLLKGANIEYDVKEKRAAFSHLNWNEFYKVVIIESMRQLANDIFTEEGFLSELKQFGDLFMGIPEGVVYEIHCERSIENIFESILYFPDTNDHLQEVQQSLKVTHMYKELGEALLQQMQKRLLITGVNTETILKFYINLLKVIQFMDPDYIIFEKVTLPIKEFLLKRQDFLRCIIGIITEENYKTERVLMPQHQDSSDDECQEKDLTTVLVSLYGSQDAFISEYQNMVAEKILTPKEFCLQQEFANIELMKIRFGEQAMQTCTTMIKDIFESRRIDTNVQTTDKLLSLIHPLFLSKTFWPISYDFKPTFKLPAQLELEFQLYQKTFEKIKSMRTLVWHHDLGSVSLTLSFQNGDFDFRCLPIHATIIGFFHEIGDDSFVDSDFISNELQMNKEDFRRRMQFWINKGVIRELRTKDSEAVNYFAVKYYKEQGILIFILDNDNSLIEEIPEDLFVSSTNFLQSNQLIQLISHHLLELLRNAGALKQEKIVQLFKTTLKNEFLMPITENNIKEAVKILVQKDKICIIGEYINIKN